MISNQILQNTIDGLKNITRIELAIVDTEGHVLATTTEGIDLSLLLLWLAHGILCPQ